MITEALTIVVKGQTGNYEQLRANVISDLQALIGNNGVTDEETFEPGTRMWRLETVNARHEDGELSAEVVFTFRTGRTQGQ